MAPPSVERKRPNLRCVRKTSFGSAPDTAKQPIGSPAAGTEGWREETMALVIDLVLLSGLTRQPSSPGPSHSPRATRLPAPVATKASSPTSPLKPLPFVRMTKWTICTFFGSV